MSEVTSTISNHPLPRNWLHDLSSLLRAWQYAPTSFRNILHGQLTITVENKYQQFIFSNILITKIYYMFNLIIFIM